MTYEDFIKSSETLFNPFIEDWKNSNKQVMGYYCTYIPEEILHAGNIMGFRMRGTEAEDTSKADSIFTQFNCSYVKATLDLTMNQKYKFLDALTIMNSCDHVRRIYDIWKYKILGKINGIDDNFPLFFLSIPHIITDHGVEWLKEEFKIFMTNLKKKFKVNITDEELKDSIKVLNQNRRLLKELHKLRVINNPKINGSEAHKINIANNSVPKEIANYEISSRLEFLKERDGISDYQVRILIAGSLIDDTKPIEIIEDVGGLVVSDLLCFGFRNFRDLTDEKGDPMDAIVSRYYHKISCPRMMDDHEKRFEVLKDQIKSARVDGIIGMHIEFCDLHGCENMLYEHELKDLDIPMLNIDRDYFLRDPIRFRTRCEAFIEQIR